MTLPELAALAAALLLTGVAVFQLALALGAPLGAYAWGGANPGVLPDRLRLGSAISGIVLLVLAVVVLIRGGLIYAAWQGEMVIAVWIVFMFTVLNTFANLRSESSAERRVMAPLTAVIALLLAFVQLSGA